MLYFEQFTKAASDVDRIIKLTGDYNLKVEIEKSTASINDHSAKTEYYRYMNSLFLNILLNRLNVLGPNAEQKALDARRILNELINPR